MGEAEGMAKEMPIMKKTRLSTGIADLDVVLEGGYTNPANILVIGPAGMEKTAIAMHFISALRENEVACIITADATPDNVREKAASIGISLPAKTKFIDCYSSTLGKQAPEGDSSFVPGPGALNDLSLALNDIMRLSEGKQLRLVFYSLSTFMLYNPPDSILKFLQVIGGRLKTASATTLMLVEDGVHDKQLLSTVEHTVDEVYNIKDKGGSLELIAPSVGIGLPIKIGPAGITIL